MTVTSLAEKSQQIWTLLSAFRISVLFACQKRSALLKEKTPEQAHRSKKQGNGNKGYEQNPSIKLDTTLTFPQLAGVRLQTRK